MMYWTDWGRKPRIEMAWMDGQHREVLVDEDLGWPTGLTVDYLNGNRIYWCDSKENSIESMKPDGTDRKVVISGGQWCSLVCCSELDTQTPHLRLIVTVLDIGHPYSLDVFEGHVYWSSKDKGEVWRTNKFGNGNKVKVLTINPWLTQVRIYQEHRHNQTGQRGCRSETATIYFSTSNSSSVPSTSQRYLILLLPSFQFPTLVKMYAATSVSSDLVDIPALAHRAPRCWSLTPVHAMQVKTESAFRLRLTCASERLLHTRSAAGVRSRVNCERCLCCCCCLCLCLASAPAAIEPPVVMPLACRCMNGGTCYTDEAGLPKCK